MKKKLLFTTIALFFLGFIKAQPFITTNIPGQCYVAPNTVATASVVGIIAGANSYSWTVTAPNCLGTFTNAVANGSIVNISYPCCGIFTIACTAYSINAAIIVTTAITTTINCAPSLTVTPSFSACPWGPPNGFTLSASGAVSYTWFPGNMVFPNAIVVPSVSTCYTVIGTNAQGCQSATTTCISYFPVVPLNIVGNNTVCLGSSAILTGTGANTYTWSIGSVSSSITVMPTVTTTYSLIATGGVNSCTAFAVHTVSVNAACSQVWPGDANSDGIVDNTDVLELGLANGSTGPARTPTSIAYTSQFANNWTGTVTTGKNKCHADCDGDGIVNASDNAAIVANFSLTHAFKGNLASSANPEIKIVPQQNVAYMGIWNKADVVLGDATNPINQLYGVAFEINYDQALVQTDSVKMLYTASFLNNASQNITFQKPIHTNGKEYAATVRIDHANVNGNGKIAEFWYKVKSGLPNNSVINLSVANTKKVSANGATGVLTTAPSTSLGITNNLVGLQGLDDIQNSVSLFPNPATDSITLMSGLNSKVNYRLYDITGREISMGEFVNSKTIVLSQYSAGTYLVRLEVEGSVFYKRLLIEE